jgi:hypothetical protein
MFASAREAHLTAGGTLEGVAAQAPGGVAHRLRDEVRRKMTLVDGDVGVRENFGQQRAFDLRAREVRGVHHPACAPIESP